MDEDDARAPAALHGVQDTALECSCTLLTRTINHRKNLVGDPGRGGTASYSLGR